MSWTYRAFRLAATVVPWLPAGALPLLSRLAGWVAWAVSPRKRAAVQANLQVVLGRPAAPAEVRATFVYAARNYFDLFFLPRYCEQDLPELVEVEGWDELVAARSQGRGVLLASLHLGNIEVVGRAARARGLELVVPVERIEPPAFLELMLGLRRRAGLRCAPVGGAASEVLRAALRENAVVGIGADRLTVGAGALVTFCGQPARLPVAAAALARRTGAPLLPCGCQRRPGGGFRVRIGPPIPVARTSDVRADLRVTTERLLAALAEYLREAPTQWVIFRPVWAIACLD